MAELEPQQYAALWDIIGKYQTNIIDIETMVVSVTHLVGHKVGILRQLNQFLPPGYHIEIVSEPSQPDTFVFITPSAIASRPLPYSPNRMRHQHPPIPPTVSAPEPEPELDALRHKAISFVVEVKHRFASELEKFQTFMDVLQRFVRGELPLAEVAYSLGHLFHGHADLLAGFREFLPEDAPYGFLPDELVSEDVGVSERRVGYDDPFDAEFESLY